MRSEGYSTWLCVCLSVCLFVYDYSRTTGYEVTYERYQSLQCYKEMKINVGIFLKRLRYGVKTSEKANIHNQHPGLRGGGGGGREGLVRTVCACALISRHSGNSVIRTDNSLFKRHDRILSGLLFGSLREREHNQHTREEKRLHSLSSVFTTCLWNTGKSTLSRVLSPRLDGSLYTTPDLTEGFCSTATEQEGS